MFLCNVCVSGSPVWIICGIVIAIIYTITYTLHYTMFYIGCSNIWRGSGVRETLWSDQCESEYVFIYLDSMRDLTLVPRAWNMGGVKCQAISIM